MSNQKKITVNGSVNGIINVGNNAINLNINEESIPQFNNNPIEKLDTNHKTNVSKLEENKLSSYLVKTVIEIIIGVVISVIAGFILYQLNMN